MDCLSYLLPSIRSTLFTPYNGTRKNQYCTLSFFPIFSFLNDAFISFLSYFIIFCFDIFNLFHVLFFQFLFSCPCILVFNYLLLVIFSHFNPLFPCIFCFRYILYFVEGFLNLAYSILANGIQNRTHLMIKVLLWLTDILLIFSFLKVCLIPLLLKKKK